MHWMRILSLLLVLGCAACAKKPAAKSPGNAPPATDEKAKPEAEPTQTNMPRTAPGDPCDGGENKHK
jgi:hypothetical protein